MPNKELAVFNAQDTITNPASKKWRNGYQIIKKKVVCVVGGLVTSETKNECFGVEI